MEFGNHKRLRTCKEANGLGCVNNGVKESPRPYKSLGNSNPFAVANLLERLSEGKYGSVTEEYESVHAQVSSFLSALRRSFGKYLVNAESCDVGVGSLPADGQEHAKPPKEQSVAAENEACNAPVIVIDSDEDDARHRQDESAVDPGHEPLAIQVWQPDHQDGAHDQQGMPVDVYRHDHVDSSELVWQPSILVQKVNLTTSAGNVSLADLVGNDEATPLLSPFSVGKSKGKGRRRAKAGENPVKRKSAEVNNNESKTDNVGSDKAVLGEKYNAIEGCNFVGDLQPPSPDVESLSQSDPEALSNDGLGDLWQDMSLAMEFSKTAVSDQPESSSEDECDHLFVLKDDLGVVCRVCGIIQKSIEKIVDYQLAKSSRTTRIYSNESRSQKDLDGILPSFSGLKSVHHDIHVADIAIHPRHEKQMKSHQLEGFQFLVKNLVADNPGGCILAHAPGSGKTFMLISFIQSFLAKYPLARPLVVLPKGILPTWKREFEKWQVEEIPIYDFYSQKADNRSQQLDVLKNWEANRSILFLGYKQFANIICDGATSKVAAACQEHLLKVPSLLIIDEGHTPRNDNTDVLNALSRVQTPRKVVLSGTLFQNHVKEVFNILNLVRPKFLKMELSRSIVTRIMSRVHISGAKRVRPDMYASFYELVEETLQCDSDLKRKITIIRDLREMTQHVLHYYKGDFLDELPGLIDFTVMLKLSAKQKQTVQKIGKMDKFRRSAICRAIYMHPYLNEISESVTGDRSCDLIVEKIDNIIDNLDVKDGVKTKFFLSVLSLSVSVGEKLLVFSQYLLPLKFLERMVARLKGWRSGKEMFMISGDSSPDEREWAMEQFNSSLDARVFFGSIKACGEGISLIGASRVIILDVHLNPSVSRQAIGRAFRPGQTKKVYVYRLVAADSPEEEDHYISFRKELTSKMWFEWNEYSKQDFEMETANIEDSEDIFFESTFLAEDVKCLYRR